MGAGDYDDPIEVGISLDTGTVSAGPSGPFDTSSPIEATMADPETAAWLGLSYSILSALMVHARYVALVHQQHHWVCKGDPFYGDHKLFQQLYEATNEQVDALAEKVVGLSSEKNLDLCIQMRSLSALVDERYGMSASIPTSSALAAKSLETEQRFIDSIAAAMDGLEAQGELTVGLENFLAQLADDHEGHKYLLKQRVGG